METPETLLTQGTSLAIYAGTMVWLAKTLLPVLDRNTQMFARLESLLRERNDSPPSTMP